MIYRLLIVLSIFIPPAAIGVGFVIAIKYMERSLLSVILGSYVAGSVAMFAIGATASVAAGHPEWMGDTSTESMGWASVLQAITTVACGLPLILAMALAVTDDEEQA